MRGAGIIAVIAAAAVACTTRCARCGFFSNRAAHAADRLCAECYRGGSTLRMPFPPGLPAVLAT